MTVVFDEETELLWTTKPNEDVPTAVDVVVSDVNGEVMGKLECVPVWVLHTLGYKSSRALGADETRMQNGNKDM
jgi:hypothetical protein